MNLDLTTSPSWTQAGLRVAVGGAGVGNNLNMQPNWRRHLLRPWGGTAAGNPGCLPDQWVYKRYFDIQKWFPQADIFNTPGFASGTDPTNLPASDNQLWLDVLFETVDGATPVKVNYMVQISFYSVWYNQRTPVGGELEVDNPQWDDIPLQFITTTDEGELEDPGVG